MKNKESSNNPFALPEGPANYAVTYYRDGQLRCRMIVASGTGDARLQAKKMHRKIMTVDYKG